VGNDYGFNNIFSRELECLASEEDILVLLSTSGNSANLLAAVQVAKRLGVAVFGLTGKGGGELARQVSCFVVPSDHTARIQEIHITLGHMLCDMIDRKLLPE